MKLFIKDITAEMNKISELVNGEKKYTRHFACDR